MKGFIYILRDECGRYYIGSTDNLSRRIQQHLSGHTQTSRNMKSPRLIFSQEYGNLEDARSIEKKLKSFKRKDYITRMVSDGFIKMRP